jgi:hypothetical protein
MMREYPYSPLKEQPKVLLFYSLARQSRDPSEKNATLLREILKIADDYKPTVDRTSVPLRPRF